jgi:hypothetical protein
MGEITATDYIERESCGILLAILHLDCYVWSFCAFLLDSSTYANSLWCPAPHARTGGVMIFAHRRLKHTDTIFYVVRQIAYIHGRESILFRDI